MILWFPLSSSVVHFWGMLWWLTPTLEPSGWDLNWNNPFFIIIRSIVYTLLRPVFAYQMVRFYQNKSSKKLTLLVGLCTELEVVVFGILPVLLVAQPYLELIIPIPFLLLAGILVMRFAPPPQKPELWLEKEEENQTWWNHDVGKDVKANSHEDV